MTQAKQYLLCIPFYYAFASRYHWPRDLIVNALTAWVPGTILTYGLTPLSWFSSIIFFFVGYIVFICIYEIGYLANDTYGVRKDPSQRMRLDTSYSIVFYVCFLLTKVCVFLIFAFCLGAAFQPLFWLGYSALVFVFFCHNILTKVEFKFLTFLQLSILRFSLPIFFPLSIYGSTKDITFVISVSVLIFVYPRFLTYLESKNRLSVPERKKPTFILFSLLFTFPVIVFLSLSQNTLVAIFVWLWLVGVQMIYIGVIKFNGLQHTRNFLGVRDK